MTQNLKPQDGNNSNVQGKKPQDGRQDSRPRTDISSPLVWSILSTFFCCLPTGIISIIYATQVNSCLSSGFYQSARKAANNAKMWAWISLGLGVVVYTFLIVAYYSNCLSIQNLQNMNNLKILGLGVSQYELSNRELPSPYTVNEDGQRLHSWRVTILPFIDQEELYKQIRLDEPWDSEWNKQFHDKCPKVFQNPLAGLAPNETTYAVVVGENTVFPELPESGKGMFFVRFLDVRDGKSNTAMIAERSPVCWMDPNSDIPFEEAIKGVNKSPKGIRSYFKGKFSVVMCDGCIQSISNDVSSDYLRKLFDRQDGEILTE